MGTHITFARPDGKEAQGYLANAQRGNAPGVIVIQEWWGLSENIKGLTDRFALAGFDALAPDLYNGVVVPYHDTDEAGKQMNSLDFMDATTQTVRGAVKYLSRNGAKVGLTGFCLGGAVTIIGAVKIPELAAAVAFYGIPPEQVAKATSPTRTPGVRRRPSTRSSRRRRRPARASSSSAMMRTTPSSTNSARRCMTARRRSWPGTAPPRSSRSTWDRQGLAGRPRRALLTAGPGRGDFGAMSTAIRQLRLWWPTS
jgi:hypothetical protein